jgi:hypothetical protein
MSVARLRLEKKGQSGAPAIAEGRPQKAVEIAPIPEIVRRLVVGREEALGTGHAQETRDVGLAVGLARFARRGIL